jgi:hypothetical protein
MKSKDTTTQDRNRAEEIMNAVKRVHYGEIVITIHDSKVMQIETRQKKRFT